MSLPGPDPNVTAAVEHLVDTDPTFRRNVQRLSLVAMQTLLYYMENGTPDQRLSIAKGFQPIFVKALTGDKGDKQTTDMLGEIRGIIGGVIPEEFKT